MVTSSDVASICLRCVIEPWEEGSAAWNERTTLRARDKIRTSPLESPKKIESDPVARQVISFCPLSQQYCRRLSGTV